MGRHNRRPPHPLEAWPELDREAWIRSNTPGDDFDEGGAGAAWRPSTRRLYIAAYSDFLLFQQRHGWLKGTTSLQDRIAEPILRSYVDVLRARLSDWSTASELRNISNVIKAMDPTINRGLLNHVASRIALKATPSQRKAGRIVQPRQLFELGLALMSEADDLFSADSKAAALAYRNGMLIALMSLAPLRSGNFSQMRLGHHLARVGNGVRITFAADEMKSRKALEVEFPRALLAALGRYLAVFRPLLLSPGCEQGMWPTRNGGTMSVAGIGNMIRKRTRERLGVLVSPHLFRDAAATFFVEMNPEWAMMAAAVLQHSNYRITEKYYVHGQQHRAARMYQQAIDELLEPSI